MTTAGLGWKIYAVWVLSLVLSAGALISVWYAP